MNEYYKEYFIEGTNRASKVFFFDSVSDVFKFNEETLNSIPVSSNEYGIAERVISQTNILNTVTRRSADIDWYGTRDTNWAGKKINQYLKSSEIQQAIQQISSNTINVNVKDIDFNKNINFNDREIGIFSFDLASLGLYSVYEYYSPLLKSIVDPNFVESYVNESQERIYYFVGLPYVPQHEVKYNFDFAGYYSRILGRVVSRNEIIEQIPIDPKDEIIYLFPERKEIPKHDVQQRQSVDETGELKFSSSYKKSFIQIEKIYKTIPRIDIIIPMSYSANVTAEQMFWNSISISALSIKLSELNLDYRIVASRSGETIKGRKRVYGFINLKNDSDSFDVNQLSIAVSDARFLRIDGFRFDYSMQYKAGYGRYFDGGVNYPVNEQASIKNAYMSYLSNQTNESDVEASANSQSKIVFPQALTMQQAINSYNNVISQIQGLLVI